MSIKKTTLLLLCVLVSFVAAKDGDMTNKDPNKNADAANKGDESLEEGGGSNKSATGTLAI